MNNNTTVRNGSTLTLVVTTFCQVEERLVSSQITVTAEGVTRHRADLRNAAGRLVGYYHSFPADRGLLRFKVWGAEQALEA